MVLVKALGYFACMIILGMTAMLAVVEALLPFLGNFCAHLLGTIVATIHVYWVMRIWSTHS